jgi:hypothetical protein
MNVGHNSTSYQTIRHSLYGIKQMRNVNAHERMETDHFALMVEYIHLLSKKMGIPINEDLRRLRIEAYYWRYSTLF